MLRVEKSETCTEQKDEESGIESETEIGTANNQQQFGSKANAKEKSSSLRGSKAGGRK